jgi:aspartate/methionine/tyrosine aminotransferase
MKPLARAAERMPRSGIRQIMELAAGISGVIHLEVGEPESNTPDEIITAAFAAAREGYTKYTANAGFPTLREAIAVKLRTVNGLGVRADQVVVTPGAVCALSSAVFATINPGDEVLIPDPGWPNYISMVVLAGGIPVSYPLVRENGYLPSMIELQQLVTPSTKMILVNSPSNPTGAVFTEKVVRELVQFAVDHDLYVLSDEVYEAFVFDGDHVPFASYDSDGRVISVFGFSKTYAMTGWRLGYAVASPEVAALIGKLQEPLVSCASSVSQKGAEAALTLPPSAWQSVREIYRGRRDLIATILAPAGLLACVPQGAFYALVDLSGVGSDTNDLARQLLTEEQVATAPGETFGSRATGMVRISFAGSTKFLEEGCERIVRFAERYRNEPRLERASF